MRRIRARSRLHGSPNGMPRLPRRRHPTMNTPRRKDLDSASYRKNRETFLTEWDGACHWCKRARATTIDHVIEQDRGADPTDQSNWVGACHKCNSRRGAEYLAKKRAATVQARTKIQNTNQKSKNQNNFFEIEKTKIIFTYVIKRNFT